MMSSGIVSVSNLFDHFDRDHVGGARLVQRQAGGDGDEIAAFDEAELQRFLFAATRIISSVLLNPLIGTGQTPQTRQSILTVCGSGLMAMIG